MSLPYNISLRPSVAEGNRVHLLVGGEQAFPAMLQAIAQARATILLEMYIFAADGTGKRFLDALVERAKAGVRVRVIIDGVGSLGTPMSFFQPLRDSGGDVAVYHSVAPWRPRWGLWRRDHRKLLVIDGSTAYLGGLNIADDYAPLSWGGGGWHDMYARVEGPAAVLLGNVVESSWARCSGSPPSADDLTLVSASLPSMPLGEGAPGNVAVRVLDSKIGRRFVIRRAYIGAIRRARSTIRITNAYFVPDAGIRWALRRAARRGVLVELLLAGKTDVPATIHATRALYTGMLGAGVRIYEWNERVLHAKVAVIDGSWCSIGSYNLDRRSLLYNQEINIACVDSTLGAKMDAQFARDSARSTFIESAEWAKRPWKQRLLEAFFFRLRRFL